MALIKDKKALYYTNKALMNVPFIGDEEYVVMTDINFINSLFGETNLSIERIKDVYSMSKNYSSVYSSFLPNFSIAKLAHLWKDKKATILRLERRRNDPEALEKMLEITLYEHNFDAASNFFYLFLFF